MYCNLLVYSAVKLTETFHRYEYLKHRLKVIYCGKGLYEFVEYIISYVIMVHAAAERKNIL